MEDGASTRQWTAWLAIIPLSLIWFFCLSLPVSMIGLTVTLARDGSPGGAAAALLLALPAAWPLVKCSRAIRGYYTGGEKFRLSVSRGDIAMAVFLLALLSFLVYNAVNYTSAARRKQAPQETSVVRGT